MAIETSSAAMISIKTGALASVFVLAMSLLSVLVGFKVVPLADGRETDDAVKRLACGFLVSLTLGPYAAYRYHKLDPGWYQFWLDMCQRLPDSQVWAVVATAAPFVCASAIAGFWVVAFWLKWFTNRAGKDVGEVLKELKP